MVGSHVLPAPGRSPWKVLGLRKGHWGSCPLRPWPAQEARGDCLWLGTLVGGWGLPRVEVSHERPLEAGCPLSSLPVLGTQEMGGQPCFLRKFLKETHWAPGSPDLMLEPNLGGWAAACRAGDSGEGWGLGWTGASCALRHHHPSAQPRASFRLLQPRMEAGLPGTRLPGTGPGEMRGPSRRRQSTKLC